MMLNMIEPGRDRSAKTQLRLQKLARDAAARDPTARSARARACRGWAAGLNIEGAGPYKLAGRDDARGSAQDRGEGDARPRASRSAC